MEEESNENITFEVVESVKDSISVPKIIFIVPYRDRSQQQQFFALHMKTILSGLDANDYKIYYSHQCDKREFNRGAMKNIGFLTMKEKYPNDYQNITFVFNDVDTMPFTPNFLQYETTIGKIKHFYGYEFALGGIVSIKGADFERICGFPNLWTWGYEDNLIQSRAVKAGLIIDRSQFYPIMDQNILHAKDGLTRIINRGEYDRYINDTKEGITGIHDLQYVIDENTGFINVHKFNTEIVLDTNKNQVHDIRTGNHPFRNNRRGVMRMMM